MITLILQTTVSHDILGKYVLHVCICICAYNIIFINDILKCILVKASFNPSAFFFFFWIKTISFQPNKDKLLTQSVHDRPRHQQPSLRGFEPNYKSTIENLQLIKYTFS